MAVTVTHPLGASAAAATGLPEGVPVSLGYVDVICNALGAGLYDPAPDVGCTIIGSTGMHMRLAPHADVVTLNEEATGYTMPFPVPGHYAQMQSNMAATLNIDWLLDLASGVLAAEGVKRSRADLIRRLDQQVLQAKPGELLFHPYISDAGERGPFVDAEACAQFFGLRSHHALWRPDAGGDGRARIRCARLLRRHGRLAREVRITGGAARSHALTAILGAALGCNVRVCNRERGGRGGRCDDCCRRNRRLSGICRPAPQEWVNPHAQRAASSRCGAGEALRAHVPRLSRRAASVTVAMEAAR